LAIDCNEGIPHGFFIGDIQLIFDKNFSTMNIPADLIYTQDHEWIRLDGDVATIGITDYAQSELGDVIFVDIDTEGEQLDAEEVFGSVEAVKTVSDLFQPFAGEVIEINEALEDSPELVNTDPYGEGWMVKIRLSNVSDADALMSASDYQSHIA
jgi:glycine cleavage system H protein|tara:strand:- start:8416 stop:8877 length:462 start_codon:yes stop_codon:yes gene_type:complete